MFYTPRVAVWLPVAKARSRRSSRRSRRVRALIRDRLDQINHLLDRRRIYVANVSCTGHAYGPVKITIQCRSGKFYAAHLRYRKYGGATASATAELVQNDCLPSCTKGMAIESLGTIKLSHVQSCDGRLYYERIAWKLIESRGQPSPHGSGTIKPRACGGP